MTISPEQFCEAAELAHVAAEQMLARLALFTLQPQRVVVMGITRPAQLMLVQKQYGEEKVVALADEYPMLQYWQTQGLSQSSLCTENFKLPFQDHSVDLLLANLILPWCEDVKKTLQEWHRVLSPNGLLMFTTLGPDTLGSLQTELKDYLLPNLVDMHIIGDALLTSNLLDPVLDVEEVNLRYANMAKMIEELSHSKMIVLNCPLATLSSNIASYEIVHAHAWGSNAMSYSQEPGVARIPLNRLRLRNPQLN